MSRLQAAVANEGPMIVTQKKELRLLTPKYCESTHQTKRRPTRTIDVSSAGLWAAAAPAGNEQRAG
jgi:hypothetical protein